MNIKRIIFRLADYLTVPLAVLTARHMWLLRRYGLPSFPCARQILLRTGVLPIRRHFYEPLFHPDDLSASLDAERRLPGIDFNEAGQVDLLSSFSFQEEIREMCLSSSPRRFWGQKLTPENNAFGHGDIDCYYSLIRVLQPKRIIEIGAGFSTMVALCAIEANQRMDPTYACALTAIEPFPWFSDERVTLIRDLVEKVDPVVFSSLKANDILFIDSSHMIRPQGDVLFEMLEILPQLASGVVVHIHDVFTPRDYPVRWVVDQHRLWNEQYLFEAFLTCNRDFEVIGALNWLQIHHARLLEEKCPTLKEKPDSRPHSFWIRKKGLSNDRAVASPNAL